MAGTDLRAGTGTQPDKVLTVDSGGNMGTGVGEKYVPTQQISHGGDFNLINKVTAGSGSVGLYEYMLSLVTITANSITSFDITGTTNVGVSMQIKGNLIGQRSGSPIRYVGDEFIGNVFRQFSSQPLYALGVGPNKFIHTNDAILDFLEITAPTTDITRLKITNNTSADILNCLINIRVLLSSIT